MLYTSVQVYADPWIDVVIDDGIPLKRANIFWNHIKWGNEPKLLLLSGPLVLCQAGVL